MQLRKAQQSEDLGKKQGTALSCKLSSASITSKKKQYTVPHPLSGKLSCVSPIKPTAEFDSMHATLRHIFEAVHHCFHKYHVHIYLFAFLMYWQI